MYGREEKMSKVIWCGKLKERDHLKSLEVEGNVTKIHSRGIEPNVHRNHMADRTNSWQDDVNTVTNILVS
jgi:hypothetical protein